MQSMILETLLLLVVGMGVVFAALFLLAGMIRAMEWTDRRINAFRIRTYAEKVETHKVDEEINDEVVAVIAAAVTAAIRKPVVVRRIRFLSDGPAPAWSVTGRLNIMASHAIAKRKSSP